MSELSPVAGWYDDPDDDQIQRYWDGAQWTGQGWYPDPEDPQARLYWDGTGWTGDKRAAVDPPFQPKKKTDWAFVGGIALGLIGALGAAAVSNRPARSTFARDWDLDGSQWKAQQRQQRYNDYVRQHNMWLQNNWYNHNPPPPPLPPTY